MAYKRLAIVGPAALVIDLHIALLPVDVHLPIGPKQGAFTIHMTGSLPGTMESLKPKKPTLHQHPNAQSSVARLHRTLFLKAQIRQEPTVPTTAPGLNEATEACEPKPGPTEV